MSIESRYCVVQRSRIQIRNKGQKAEKDKKAKLKGFGFLVWTNLTKGFFFSFVQPKSFHLEREKKKIFGMQ
jgi:lipocalin